jgi:polar amino acid transport system substrate-binding protein
MGLRTTLSSLVLGLALASCATTPAGAGHGPWIVASNLDNPPFAWVDNTGEPRGRDVVMAQIMAESLGRELVWRRMPFTQVLDALERGEVDSVIATLGYTPERAQRVRMSRPYYVTSLRALVRIGPGEPQELADLVGKTLSVGEGTTSERAARRYSGSVVLSDPSPISRLAFERLHKREVDAGIMDGPIAHEFAAEYADFLRVLPMPIATEAYVVGVRPDAPELLHAINAILARMQAEGLLEELDQLYEVPRSERLDLE